MHQTFGMIEYGKCSMMQVVSYENGIDSFVWEDCDFSINDFGTIEPWITDANAGLLTTKNAIKQKILPSIEKKKSLPKVVHEPKSMQMKAECSSITSASWGSKDSDNCPNFIKSTRPVNEISLASTELQERHLFPELGIKQARRSLPNLSRNEIFNSLEYERIRSSLNNQCKLARDTRRIQIIRDLSIRLDDHQIKTFESEQINKKCLIPKKKLKSQLEQSAYPLCFSSALSLTFVTQFPKKSLKSNSYHF